MPHSELSDALGVYHTPIVEPARIVCLVPSITELLFTLGLGDQVVGRTRYCVHPAERVHSVACVGGTKQIKQAVLKRLQPTHVIVNIDENPKGMVEEIANYVPHIIVTHPLAPRDNLTLYRLLGGIFRREAEAEWLCQRFERALAAAQEESRYWPRRKVLYLIWRKPWMTVTRDTYISRTLALVCWETLPASAKERYPPLEITQELLTEAELILFSSEPYPFKPKHLEAFSRVHQCPPDKLLFIDGQMTSWYGSRALAGLEYLLHLARGLN